MSVAGLERMATGSVAKRLTRSRHTGRQPLRFHTSVIQLTTNLVLNLFTTDLCAYALTEFIEYYKRQ